MQIPTKYEWFTPLIHITNSKLETFDIGHETIINLLKGVCWSRNHY